MTCFKTIIGVSCRAVKAVTITVYFTTGTVLVQGNRCTEGTGGTGGGRWGGGGGDSGL